MSKESIRLPARSVSSILPVAPHESRPLRVLSVHRRALNLLDDAGRIIAVVTPEVGDGPFHIVLHHSLSLDFVQSGIRAWRQGDELKIGNRVVDWTQARRWDPHLTPVSIPKRSLTLLTACVNASDRFQKRMADMDQRSLPRLQMGAALLDKGVKQGDEQALRKGASLLVGLGPGLTPAGDDYLLGVLARLHMDNAFPAATPLPGFVETGATLTTKLSRAWLLHSARGQFDERWHALQKALRSRDERAICEAAQRILSVGASSGPQAMAGFLLT